MLCDAQEELVRAHKYTLGTILDQKTQCVNLTVLPLYKGKLVATEKKTTNTDPETLLKPRLEWAIAAQRRQWRRGSGARVAFRAPRSGDSGGGSRGA